jgi:hypothetical protein
MPRPSSCIPLQTRVIGGTWAWVWLYFCMVCGTVDGGQADQLTGHRSCCGVPGVQSSRSLATLARQPLVLQPCLFCCKGWCCTVTPAKVASRADCVACCLVLWLVLATGARGWRVEVSRRPPGGAGGGRRDDRGGGGGYDDYRRGPPAGGRGELRCVPGLIVWLACACAWLQRTP